MEFLDFFKNSLNLKNISRQGWIDKLSIEHPESVADHSYSMAIMGMVISDFENYDTEKILKMILLHDLAESKIGDFTPEQITKSEKEKIENHAFYDIIETLPNSIKSPYTSIWKEYQNQISVEAKRFLIVLSETFPRPVSSTANLARSSTDTRTAPAMASTMASICF